jgi:hypothetical protein
VAQGQPVQEQLVLQVLIQYFQQSHLLVAAAVDQMVQALVVLVDLVVVEQTDQLVEQEILLQ